MHAPQGLPRVAYTSHFHSHVSLPTTPIAGLSETRTNMPVYIAVQALADGLDSIPFIWPILKTLPWLGALYLLKLFFSGASNGSERNMHAKVVLVTVRASYHYTHTHHCTTTLRNCDNRVAPAA